MCTNNITCSYNQSEYIVIIKLEVYIKIDFIHRYEKWIVHMVANNFN